MKILRWFTLWLITKRAVKAHKKKGYSTKELVGKITAQPRYVSALAMCGISDRELSKAIKNKIKKEGEK